MQCDLDGLYDRLVSVALDLTDAEEGYLFVVDPNTEFLHLRKASNGMETDGLLRRPEDAGPSLKPHSKPILIPNSQLKPKPNYKSDARPGQNHNLALTLTPIMTPPISLTMNCLLLA